jgi:hypothetical protein
MTVEINITDFLMGTLRDFGKQIEKVDSAVADVKDYVTYARAVEDFSFFVGMLNRFDTMWIYIKEDESNPYYEVFRDIEDQWVRYKEGTEKLLTLYEGKYWKKN